MVEWMDAQLGYFFQCVGLVLVSLWFGFALAALVLRRKILWWGQSIYHREPRNVYDAYTWDILFYGVSVPFVQIGVYKKIAYREVKTGSSLVLTLHKGGK